MKPEIRWKLWLNLRKCSSQQTDRIVLKRIRSHRPSQWKYECFAKRFSLFEKIFIMKSSSETSSIICMKYSWFQESYTRLLIILIVSFFICSKFNYFQFFLFVSDTKSRFFIWTLKKSFLNEILNTYICRIMMRLIYRQNFRVNLYW